MDKKKNLIVDYFKESLSEFKRITWPKKNEVINLTFLAIIIIIIISLILGFFDIVSKRFVFFLFQ